MTSTALTSGHGAIWCHCDAVAAYLLDTLNGDTTAWHDLHEKAAASSSAFSIDSK
ncbi:MAG: hypothetical protein ACRYF3_07010 [Janthinobacterium lividum]